MRVRYSFGSRHTGRIANIKKQRGKYPDVMKDVVRISDVVLEILDARFIDETRNLEVEADVLKKGKKLIYVLNKVDLVDAKKLEIDLPREMKPYVFVSAMKGIGLRDIKSRIKMEAKRIISSRKSYLGVGVLDENGKKKQGTASEEKWNRVHVGVIGYPNAGKSSVINFITRRGVAKTAKQAGFTKGMQKIRMSEDILILDTPGVIPDVNYSTDVKSFARDVKVGARSSGDVKDPDDMIAYLMTVPEPEDEENVTPEEKRAIKEAEKNAGAIEKFYEIDAKGNSEVLIEKLGRKKNFLKKGGVIDTDRTARLVLRDWQEGAIRVG